MMRGKTSRTGETPNRSRRSALPPVVTSPKTSAAYQAHSYPTKIPPEAIAPFIEASSQPGGLVLDPFCGSGMTGVAALACGRSAILSDLSPGAVHLARNHTRRVESAVLLDALRSLDRVIDTTERRLYTAACPSCRGSGRTRHTIWSEIHACPGCGAHLRLWDFADDDGSVPRSFSCPHCRTMVKRSGGIAMGVEPVQVVVSCDSGCSKLQTGEPDSGEVARILSFAGQRVRHWMPSVPIEPQREMYKRSALQLRGVTNVRDFYLPRAQLALSRLWVAIDEVRPASVREALQFAFTNTAWHASRMRRYNARGGQRPLSGTLYIPQLVAEANVFEVFRHQVQQVAAFYEGLAFDPDVASSVRCSSAADLSWIGDATIDYVFTDPPFGSNIFYADCNIVWESWLGSVTDADKEMVVNRSRSQAEGGKSVDDYGGLLASAFSEMRRVVRPNGRVSVVFHNSDDEVWTALLRAAEEAGLRQIEVSLIDKVQRSMKGYKGRSGTELVPFYDLVITFSPGRAIRPHLNGAGEIAVDVVRRHLDEIVDLPGQARERSLEYLYSLAVSQVVATGAKPEGLSYRAFESLCGEHFARRGQHFAIA